jgi:hypothetical protein
MRKVQKLENITKASNPRAFYNKRNEIRRINEAYQVWIDAAWGLRT